MKNIFLFQRKISFRSRDTEIFVFFVITHFVWYLDKEKSYDIETLSIDRVLDKEHFYGKIMQKMCTKS